MKKNDTIESFAKKIFKIYPFRFITVDSRSIKLFNESPKYEINGGFWRGDCIGMFTNHKDLDLSEYSDGFRIKYSNVILEMIDNG